MESQFSVVNVNQTKLNDEFEHLLKIFPDIFSVLIVKDNQFIFERYKEPASQQKATNIK